MAKELKLVNLAAHTFAERWDPLKEVLKKNFDVDLQVEIKTVTSENLKSLVKEVLASDAQGCLIDPEFTSKITEFLPSTTMEVSMSDSAGILIREEKKWWPKALFDEAFSRTTSECIGQLDLSAQALVVGATGSAKLIIASLVKMGFVNVNIAEQDAALGEAAIKNLQRRFFNVKFNFVPGRELTTLPGVNSIVINTNPLSEKDEIYPELYFFNFLKSGGVVVDLTLVPSKTPLIIEAERWGARYVSGDAVAAHQDALIVEYILGEKIEIEPYRKSLREMIDAVPFDPSPYLKQFQDRGL